MNSFINFKTNRTQVAIIAVALLIIVAIFSVAIITSTGCSSQKDSQSPAIELADNEVLIASTTDMHGRVWEEDIPSGKVTKNNYLAVQTLFESINTKLAKSAYIHDNGDIFQGTDMSTYNLKPRVFRKYHDVSPAAIALQVMKYDSFTPGNHEWNYDYDIMQNTYSYLKAVGIDPVACNVYYSDTNQRVFQPYKVKTLSANGMEIKVGVIGVCNTDTPRWDSSDKYPGIQFHSADNPNADISVEIKKAQDQMAADGQTCDITIVATHSGFLAEGEKKQEGKDYFAQFEQEAQQPLQYLKNTENQTYRAIRNSTGIDMFITGHDHVNYFSNQTVKNAEGRDVLIQSGGGTDVTLAKYALSKEANGKVKATYTDSKNVSIENYKVNESLQSIISKFAEDSMRYFEKSADNFLATLKGGWDNGKDLQVTDTYAHQTDVEDFICRAAIWGSNKYIGAKYSLESFQQKIHSLYGNNVNYTSTDGTIRADMSLTSPALSMQNPHDGDLYKVDVYKIYKYENTMGAHMMSGKDIKNILEYNASQRLNLSKDENGNNTVSVKGDKFTYLLSYGLNFEYDLEKPEGSRVQIFGFSNGKTFDENAYYLVTDNNYIMGNTSNPSIAKFNDSLNLYPTEPQPNGVDDVASLMDEYAKAMQDKYGAFYNTNNCEKNDEKASHWRIVNID